MALGKRAAKNKIAHVRISESDDSFIRDNELSKTKIFELGLTIIKLSIREDVEAITYRDKNGCVKTLVLED